jgi:hypothetical protein
MFGTWAWGDDERLRGRIVDAGVDYRCITTVGTDVVGDQRSSNSRNSQYPDTSSPMIPKICRFLIEVHLAIVVPTLNLAPL